MLWKENIDSFIPKAEPNWKTSDLVSQTSVVVSLFFFSNRQLYWLFIFPKLWGETELEQRKEPKAKRSNRQILPGRLLCAATKRADLR